MAQTNKIAIENGYMSERTAAARLSIDYDREIEQQRNDIERLKELSQMMVEAGLKPDMSAKNLDDETDTGNPGDRGGQADVRPPRDRSKEGDGADASVDT